MARVLLRNITKRYGDVLAVDNFNLDIRESEFVVLVGPSGCGKTTTLRMIAGLEDITEGELFIGDRLVNKVHPKDRDIAMVFQNYALYPHMSVFDNMAFGLKLRKMPKAEIKKRVDDAARILDIGAYLDRKPKALSGGQRQRVAMGRAIVRDPQVFLFDEPLSNLDAKLRVQMRIEITRLHKRLNRTIVYVTHDQVEAMTLADRIVIMSMGVLQQAGTPIEVYDHPLNTFVAAFIGSPGMNFIDVDIATSGGLITARAAGFSLRLGDDLKSLLPADGKGRVGFRPQHVLVADEKSDPASCFEAQVEFVENMGAEKFVHTTTGEIQLIARVEGSVELRPGDRLKLTVAPPRIHLFDGEGRNVRAPKA